MFYDRAPWPRRGGIVLKNCGIAWLGVGYFGGAETDWSRFCGENPGGHEKNGHLQKRPIQRDL